MINGRNMEQTEQRQNNQTPANGYVPYNNGKPSFGKIVKKIISIILFFAICITVAFFLSKALFATVPIKGPSMESTLYSEDRVLLYKLGKYKHGDVVIFDSGMVDEKGDPRYLVKRIIAFSGETVEIAIAPSGEYSVYLNDIRLIEDYLDQDMPRSDSSYEKIIVPEGKFFYLGDNRLQSADSRMGMFGNVDDIVGRAILKYHGTNFFNELTPIPRVKGYVGPAFFDSRLYNII